MNPPELTPFFAFSDERFLPGASCHMPFSFRFQIGQPSCRVRTFKTVFQEEKIPGKESHFPLSISSSKQLLGSGSSPNYPARGRGYASPFKSQVLLIWEGLIVHLYICKIVTFGNCSVNQNTSKSFKSSKTESMPEN